MGEIDRLIASSLGGTQSRPLSTYIGPTGLGAADSWETWALASGTAEVPTIPVFTWIGMSTAVDLVFIVCYGYLLLRIAGVDELWSRPRFWSRGASNFAVRSVLALVTADLIEDLGHIILICSKVIPNPTWAGWLWALSALKWSALAWVLFVFIRSQPIRSSIATYASRARHALYTHRLALIVLLLLGTLSLVPLGNIFDQLPDVHRQWLDGGNTGIRHAIAATISLLIVSTIFFFIGRWRSRMEWMTYVRSTPPFRAAKTHWWMSSLVVVLVGLVASYRAYGVMEWGMLLYALPATLILVVFALTRVPWFVKMPWFKWVKNRAQSWYENRRRQLTTRSPDKKLEHLRRAEFTVRTGDVIAVLLSSVGSLSLVRAFTAPMAITAAGYSVAGADTTGAMWLFAGGIVGILALPVIGMRWVCRHTYANPRVVVTAARRITPVETPAEEPYRPTAITGSKTWLNPFLIDPSVRMRTNLTMLLIVIAISLAFLIGAALWPFEFAGFLGAAAMTICALGSWSLLIGAIVLSLQQERPPAAFEVFHFRATPVLTLLFAVPIVAGLNGGIGALHAIRSTTAETVSGGGGNSSDGLNTGLDDQIVASAWKSWTSKPPPVCHMTFPQQLPQTTPSTIPLQPAPPDVPVHMPPAAAPNTPAVEEEPGSPTSEGYVRPVLLVAAEGGGIRAAYWTGRTMEALAQKDPCVSDSVLLSSGVSGGSVGLVLSAAVGDGAKKGDISADLNDLSDSRTLSTAMAGYLGGDSIATVTGIRIPSLSNGPLAWHDRAALIEMAWESRADKLAENVSAQPVALTGTLLLNSTDSVSGCRIIVGMQTPLPTDDTPPSGHDVACDAAGNGTAAAISFQQLTGSGKCAAELRWSTAAMLSARFPFVTPAGRLPKGDGPCNSPDLVQLVDGGYADNTGLSTLADLAPEVAERIMKANTAAKGTEEEPFILPVLLYAQNSMGGDIETAGHKTADPLIALTDSRVKQTQVTSAAWIQRIVSGLENVCPPVSSACTAVQGQFRKTIPSGVVVVSPTTRPSIAPPLGWTLSGFSRANLNAAFTEQTTQSCRAESFGRLGDLFALETVRNPAEHCR
ncbi:patatin-like phospholipase family protein [Pseudarthrobacter sp. RMG13]|uniref:Patatin-like phospholipase family protein n=1 Tax=Pseudarthrobacter humi TaxID=2952523 RepID=A0ABT1LPB6_9MICC|nr:patatin-like phospholipase family protein [Pseudarthrobacter humi]MCP9000305.1 patatin-like phospholipase family protein [Pseudarthrobacter humi]